MRTTDDRGHQRSRMVGGLNKSQWRTDYDSEWRWTPISTPRSRARFSSVPPFLSSPGHRSDPFFRHIIDPHFPCFALVRRFLDRFIARRPKGGRSPSVKIERGACLTHTHTQTYLCITYTA